MRKARLNPLWWAGLAAIGVIVSEVLNLSRGGYVPRVALVRVAAFAIALTLLVLRSRYAWHSFLIAIVIITPLTLLNVTDAGIKYHYPNIIWVHAAFTCLGLALVLKFRRSYFDYLKLREPQDR